MTEYTIQCSLACYGLECDMSTEPLARYEGRSGVEASPLLCFFVVASGRWISALFVCKHGWCAGQSLTTLNKQTRLLANIYLAQNKKFRPNNRSNLLPNKP
jgi:hypothetical protein